MNFAALIRPAATTVVTAGYTLPMKVHVSQKLNAPAIGLRENKKSKINLQGRAQGI